MGAMYVTAKELALSSALFWIAWVIFKTSDNVLIEVQNKRPTLKETFPNAGTETQFKKVHSFATQATCEGVFDGRFATLTAWLQTEFKWGSQSVYT